MFPAIGSPMEYLAAFAVIFVFGILICAALYHPTQVCKPCGLAAS